MKKALIFFSCMLLVACVHTGNLHDEFLENEQMQSLPQNWQNSFTEGSIGNDWVRDFDDSTLVSLVQLARTSNTAIAIATTRVSTSYSQANAVSGGQLPNINATFNASRSARNTEPMPDDYIYTNAFDASLGISWDIDLWGKLSADAKAAAYDVENATAQYQQQLHKTSADLANTWFALVACVQLKNIAEQRISRANELLNAAKESYQLGLEVLLSVQNQQIQVSNEQQNLLEQQADCRTQQRQLTLLTGKYTLIDLPQNTALPALPVAPATDIPSSLLRRRPDLLAAQATLKSAYEGIASARAGRFPSFGLSANLSRSNEEVDALLDNINLFRLASSLTIPLFSFGRLEAQETTAKSRAAESELQFLQTIQNAINEVENHLDTEQTLLQKQEHIATRYGLAKESITVAQAQYNAGISSFTDWVNAEISLFNTLAARVRNKLSLLQNRVNLHLALGGSPLSEFGEKPDDNNK